MYNSSAHAQQQDKKSAKNPDTLRPSRNSWSSMETEAPADAQIANAPKPVSQHNNNQQRRSPRSRALVNIPNTTRNVHANTVGQINFGSSAAEEEEEGGGDELGSSFSSQRKDSFNVYSSSAVAATGPLYSPTYIPTPRDPRQLRRHAPSKSVDARQNSSLFGGLRGVGVANSRAPISVTSTASSPSFNLQQKPPPSFTFLRKGSSERAVGRDMSDQIKAKFPAGVGESPNLVKEATTANSGACSSTLQQPVAIKPLHEMHASVQNLAGSLKQSSGESQQATKTVKATVEDHYHLGFPSQINPSTFPTNISAPALSTASPTYGVSSRRQRQAAKQKLSPNVAAEEASDLGSNYVTPTQINSRSQDSSPGPFYSAVHGNPGYDELQKSNGLSRLKNSDPIMDPSFAHQCDITLFEKRRETQAFAIDKALLSLDILIDIAFCLLYVISITLGFCVSSEPANFANDSSSDGTSTSKLTQNSQPHPKFFGAKLDFSLTNLTIRHYSAIFGTPESYNVIISVPLVAHYLACALSAISLTLVFIRIPLWRFSRLIFPYLVDITISVMVLSSLFYDEKFFIPYFLRCLSLVLRLQQFLRLRHAPAHLFETHSLLHDKMTRLFATIFAILFLAVCCFQLVEFVRKNKLISTIDTLYFMIVTISTVGYGDYVPSSTPSRIVVMLTILVAFLVLPTMVSSAFSTYKATRGATESYKPKWGGPPHAVAIGDFHTHQRLFEILIAFSRNRTIADRFVVLLSYEAPRQEVRALLNAPLFRDRCKYIVGSALSQYDLKRAAVARADAIFLFPQKSGRTEDERNVLRLWSVKDAIERRYCTEQIMSQHNRSFGEILLGGFKFMYTKCCKLFVRRSDAQRKNFLADVFSTDSNSADDKAVRFYVATSAPEFAHFHAASVAAVVCPDELNLALIASGCVNVGSSTLISNLLIASISDCPDPCSPWEKQYADGAHQELFCVRCNPVFIGRAFSELAVYLYSKFRVLLLGLRVYFTSSYGAKNEYPIGLNLCHRVLLNPSSLVLTGNEQLIIFAHSVESLVRIYDITLDMLNNDIQKYTDIFSKTRHSSTFSEHAGSYNTLLPKENYISNLQQLIEQTPTGPEYAQSIPNAFEAEKNVLNELNPVSLPNTERSKSRSKDHSQSIPFSMENNSPKTRILNSPPRDVSSVTITSAESFSRHIVVFTRHWHIYRLLELLRGPGVPSDRLNIVVFVGSRQPTANEFRPLAKFAGVYYMTGSARDSSVLRRVCLSKASRVIIIKPNKNLDQSNQPQEFGSNYNDKNDRLFRDRESDDGDGDGHSGSSKHKVDDFSDMDVVLTRHVVAETMDRLSAHRPFLMTTLSNSSSLLYVGPTGTSTASAMGTRYLRAPGGSIAKSVRLQSRSTAADLLYHPLYASGEVLLESMVSTILVQEYLRPGVLDVVRLLTGLHSREDVVARSVAYATRPHVVPFDPESTESSTSATRNVEESLVFLQMLNLPPSMHKVKYGVLLQYLVLRVGILPIGLYRASLTSGMLNSRPYVYANPHPETILFASDVVYVVAPDISKLTWPGDPKPSNRSSIEIPSAVAMPTLQSTQADPLAAIFQDQLQEETPEKKKSSSP